MGILGKLFRKPAETSVNSIQFDDSRYKFQGEHGGARVWFAPATGGVSLHHFPKPPDLPSEVEDEAELREFYAEQIGDTGEIVDCQTLMVDDIFSVWFILKTWEPGRDEGMIYLGSLTVPFEDFSFVIKLQCQEAEVTGLRESTLVAKAIQDGSAELDEEGNLIRHGWSFDDEKFDYLFPHHPLTKLRKEMHSIADSITIDKKTCESPRFTLFAPQS